MTYPKRWQDKPGKVNLDLSVFDDDYVAPSASTWPGGIMIVDLVKYSRLLEHGNLANGIVSALENETKQYFRHEPNITQNLTYVPLGDGFLIAVTGIEPTAWHMLGLAIHLCKFVKKWAWNGRPIELFIRVGLHEGKWQTVYDTYGRRNVFGREIVKCARLLPFSNGGCHVLISGSFFFKLLTNHALMRRMAGSTDTREGVERGIKLPSSKVYDVSRELKQFLNGRNVPPSVHHLDDEQKVMIRELRSTTGNELLDKHGQGCSVFNLYAKHDVGQEVLIGDLAYADSFQIDKRD